MLVCSANIFVVYIVQPVPIFYIPYLKDQCSKLPSYLELETEMKVNRYYQELKDLSDLSAFHEKMKCFILRLSSSQYNCFVRKMNISLVSEYYARNKFSIFLLKKTNLRNCGNLLFTFIFKRVWRSYTDYICHMNCSRVITNPCSTMLITFVFSK